MRNLLKELGKTTYWIKVLALLLIILNTLGFLVYVGSKPDESYWIQVWNYLDSKIFNIITISLIFPIILIFLERRLKIIDTFTQNHLERVRKRREETRGRQWECIEKTSKMWAELWDITTRVISFNKNQERNDNKETKKEISMNELITRMMNDLTPKK